MKKKMLSLLAAVLLLLACPALAEEADLQAEANAAYVRVILAGAPYETLVTLSLNDQGEPTVDALPEKAVLEQTPVRFAVLDMDADGVNEVILELDQPERFVLLTYRADNVYGTEGPYRGMLDLKDDGTFSYSSGELDSGVAKLTLEEIASDDPVIGYAIGGTRLACSYTAEDDDVGYIIGEEDADEAAFTAFLAEQEAKLDALWYDFTQDQVKLLLGQ